LRFLFSDTPVCLKNSSSILGLPAGKYKKNGAGFPLKNYFFIATIAGKIRPQERKLHFFLIFQTSEEHRKFFTGLQNKSYSQTASVIQSLQTATVPADCLNTT
jgi:hypothetical protein